jgi:hypothetical protein
MQIVEMADQCRGILADVGLTGSEQPRSLSV